MKFGLEVLTIIYFFALFVICAFVHLRQSKERALFIFVVGLIVYGILVGVGNTLFSEVSETESIKNFPKLKRK